MIKVNGLLTHNQVYAAPEDLDFVKNYIISHCPRLSDTGKEEKQSDIR